MASPELQGEGFTGMSSVGCARDSWAPEIYSFYGDGETILQKISNFEMNLPDRRIYLFLVESEDESELSLFEAENGSYENGKKFRVSRARRAPDAELRGQIHRAILENHGVACVGEQTKAIVKGVAEMTDEGAIPAPASGAAAFGHTLREFGDRYSSGTVFLLC